jgi:hypothetical protein
MNEIKRVVPLDEVVENDYKQEAELAVIFNHDIVEMEDGTWRWRPNRLARLMLDYCPVFTPCSLVNEQNGEMGYSRHCTEGRASLSLNGLVMDLHDGAFSVEEYMKFLMQTGYSLCGFSDCFAQHDAFEYKLPGAKTEHAPDQDPDDYIENVIEYMLRVHKGEVLKI